LEVADIFREHGEAYRRTHALTSEQLKVMSDIEACRTAILGGHMDTCDHCGHEVPSYNSCLNRHCPKCQGHNQAKWLELRQARTLPTHYFHTVFTLPEELRSVARCNRKVIFNMLFKASSETLIELGKDNKHLGGLLGITAVLHTWTRALDFHPHVHCIVTGGGLDEKNGQWIATDKDFLFPVQVLSRLFRGKFLAALDSAHRKGTLEFAGAAAMLKDKSRFAALKDRLYGKEWVVYAKRPFGGSMQVFKYLGRYTHRVAISNYRLVSIGDASVTFKTRNEHTVTLTSEEFIRRFLMHVLPKGFVKIRHYGLKSSTNAKTKLEQARKIIEADLPNDNEPMTDDYPKVHSCLEQTLASIETDRALCPRCKKGKMIRTHIPRGASFQISLEPEDTS
jgi:hypothetical protein